MRQKTTTTLFAYWNELRAGRIAPRRLEVEPSRISAILAETFMLERVDGVTYPFRLAGTKLCEIFGMELRGTNFLERWSDRDRLDLERDLQTVCHQGGVASLSIEVRAGDHRHAELDAILLPLLHADNTVGRIIGAVSATSAANWLGTDEPISYRVLRRDIIWPDGRPHSVVERAGRRAPFVPTLSGAPPLPGRVRSVERPRLRVVEGGRKYEKI
jgi:hypothetical protein